MQGNFHVRSTLLYLGCWFFLALLYNEVIVLVALLVAGMVFLGRLGQFSSLLRLLKVGLPLVLLVVLLNSLFNQNGQQILWTGLAGGRLVIYREAVLYGLVMAVKLLLVFVVLLLFQILVPMDRLLEAAGPRAGKMVFLAVLTTRLLPELGRKSRSLLEIQQMRGCHPRAGGKMSLPAVGIWLKNMLRISLQIAFQSAEAMQARAFASGPRSCYHREIWQARDWGLVGLCLLAAGWAVGTVVVTPELAQGTSVGLTPGIEGIMVMMALFIVPMVFFSPRPTGRAHINTNTEEGLEF